MDIYNLQDIMDIDENSQNYETQPRGRKRRLSDEEETVFNYMTGMYERVKESKTLDTDDISTIENYGTVIENDPIESMISLPNFNSLSDTTKANDIPESKNISPTKDTEIDVVVNNVYGGASNSSRTSGSSQNKGIMKYKCYDCIYETLHINSLKEHITEHPDSNFKCSQHQQLQENCIQCIYQKCLSTLDSPSETPTIHVHSGSEESILKKLKCSTCPFETIHPIYLRKHVCFQKNHELMLRTNSTTSSKCKKEVDSDEFSDADLHEEGSSINRSTAEDILEPTSNQLKTQRTRAKVEHNGCEYEVILKELKNEVFDCEECDFKTLREVTFLKHKRNCRKSEEIERTSDVSISNECKFFEANLVEASYNRQTERLVDLHRHQDSQAQGTKEKPADLSTSSSEVNTRIRNDDEGYVPENCHNSSSIELAPPKVNQHCKSESNDENMETQKTSQLQLKDEDHVSDFESKDSITLLSNELYYENGSQVTSNLELNYYKCFECDFTTNKRRHLRTHAIEHDGSFKCVEHYETKPTCLKCIYQDCATPLKAKSRQFKCFDCSYRTYISSNLYRHSWQHRDSNYSCPIHLLLNLECDMCYYKNCLRKLESKKLKCDRCGYLTLRSAYFARHKCPTKRQSSHINQKYYKCFDCDYKTPRKDALQVHASRHEDSKYSCPNHRVLDVKCDMCFYRKCVESLSRKLCICDDCGYRTYSSFRFARHKCENNKNRRYRKVIDSVCSDAVSNAGSNVVDIPGSSNNHQAIKRIRGRIVQGFKCFHCNFVSHSRKFFKFHAVKHYNREFKCSMHLDAKVDRCNSCEYEQVLKEVRDKVFHCQKCDFKTLRKLTFSRHKLDKSCQKSIQAEGTSASSGITPMPYSNDRERMDSDCSDALVRVEGGRLVRSTAEDFPGSTGNQHKIQRNNIIQSAPPNGNQQCESESNDEGMETQNRSHLNDEDHASDFESKDAITLPSNELDYKIDPQDPSNLELNYYKCFECDFRTNKRRHLRTHANRHDGSFKCIEHYGIKSTCLKCIYQDCALRKSNQTSIEGKSRQFKCFDCSYRTNLRGHLQRHSWKHRDSTYSCRIHRVLNLKCDMCYYMNCLRKLESKKLKCPTCSYETITTASFKEHMDKCRKKINAKSSGNRQFKCFDCSYRTYKSYDLQMHSWKHRDSSYSCPIHLVLNLECDMCCYMNCLRKLESMKLRCSTCNYETITKASFSFHLCSLKHRKQMRRQNLMSSSKCPEKVNSKYLFKTRQFKCFDCSYRTYMGCSLQRHSWKHKDSNYLCPIHIFLNLKCDMCYYMNCLRKLESKRLKCDSCDYTTFRNDRLAKHRCPEKLQSSDINRKYYKCFDCDYRTLRKNHLQSHAPRHEGSKYSCPIHLVLNLKCDMCYYKNCLSKLESKKLKCADCDYTTFRRALLAKHKCPGKPQSSHINQKYYKCFDCDYRALSKDLLQRHAFRHADSKYSCPDHRVLDVKCDMCSYRKCLENLSSRMRKCDYCDYTTYRKYLLDKHRKRKH